MDTQGLLDRVFPLPADPADSASLDGPQSHQQQSYSFRTLLKESSRHPLRVLRVSSTNASLAGHNTQICVFSLSSLPSNTYFQSLHTPVLGLRLPQLSSLSSAILRSPFLTKHLSTLVPQRSTLKASFPTALMPYTTPITKKARELHPLFLLSTYLESVNTR